MDALDDINYKIHYKDSDNREGLDSEYSKGLQAGAG